MLLAGNVEGMLRKQWSKKKLCDDVETVRGFIYLGDRVNAGGGCENAATAGARCWLFKFSECGESLNGKRFPLRQKGIVYNSYARPALLFGSEALCPKEGEIGIL